MITLLSRKVDYALLILSHLHERQHQGQSAREIAERFNLSKAFIANILKELCQKGFVVSQRGVKGGYVLQRPADQILFTDLLEQLEEGFRIAECTHTEGEERPACTLEHQCPIRTPMMQIHRRMMKVFQGLTLAELFADIVDTNVNFPSRLQLLPATATI